MEFFEKYIQKIITKEILIIEHSAWRQMKQNHQIHLPLVLSKASQLIDREPQISNKKMKTMFLWNMSMSQRLFPEYSTRKKKTMLFDLSISH